LEDDIKNYYIKFEETEWEGVDWIDLTKDTDKWRGSAEHSGEISGSTKWAEMTSYWISSF